MPRTARRISESGYYHVILKGVNGQDIFMDDGDRWRMLYTLMKYSRETGVKIVVFCLMTNHIHLLVCAPEKLDLFVQKLACSYVAYFNKKYERSGHLFQNRYKSIPIDNEAYFLEVARYILQNPEKAGLGATNRYRWSSWRELGGNDGVSSPEALRKCFANEKEMRRFLLANSKCEMGFEGEYESRRITESDAADILMRISGCQNTFAIARMPKETRKDVISRAKEEGLSIRQIERLTGISKSVIQRM